MSCLLERHACKQGERDVHGRLRFACVCDAGFGIEALYQASVLRSLDSPPIFLKHTISDLKLISNLLNRKE